MSKFDTTMMSFYKRKESKTQERDISFNDYINMVRTGKNEDDVIEGRKYKQRDPEGLTGGTTRKKVDGKWADVPETNADRYKAIKNKTLCVTASATMDGKDKQAQNISELNGFIVVDIDTEIDDETFVRLSNDEYTRIIHRSFGGDGVCIFVKIDADRFLDAFRGLECYYSEKYNIEIDASCKNKNRLRFLSYDPGLIEHTKSATFKKYLKKVPKTQTVPHIVVQSDFDAMVKKIADSYINLTENYSEWLDIGFAIASEFGESGRDYFHAISSTSSKYDRDDTDRKYTSLSKEGGRPGGITIATLFWRARNAGIEIYSENTERIIRKASQDLARGKFKKGDDESIDQWFDEISTNDPLKINEAIHNNPENKEIAKKVINSDVRLDKHLGDQGGNDTAELEIFINENYPMEFDIFKQKNVFRDGSRLDKRKRNSICLDAKKAMSFDVSKTDVDMILDSDEIPEFDPLKRFIENNKDHPTNNELNRLVDTLNIDGDLAKQTAMKNFVKKWFVSIFASTSGDYSPLCLVLQGEHGDGKSYWLEHLLPDDLSSYCAFYTTTGTKEDTMMLHQNLIIVNDEFGGQTMKDAQKFKELVSKPVAKYIPKYSNDEVEFKRVAVFAGTTNEETFMNDGTGNRRIIPIRLKPREEWAINGYAKPTNQKGFAEIDKTALIIDAWNTYNDPDFDWRILDEAIEELNTNTADFELKSEEHELVFKHCVVDSCGKLTSTDIKVELQRRSGLQRLGLKKIGFALAELGATKTKRKSWEWNVRFHSDGDDIDSTPPWEMPGDIPI